MALLREYTKLERVLWFLNNSQFIRSAHVILSGEPWFISHSHHQAGARGYHIVEQPGAFLHGKIQGKLSKGNQDGKTAGITIVGEGVWDPVDDLPMIFLDILGTLWRPFQVKWLRLRGNWQGERPLGLPQCTVQRWQIFHGKQPPSILQCRGFLSVICAMLHMGL
jgi:hypothetical protein